MPTAESTVMTAQSRTKPPLKLSRRLVSVICTKSMTGSVILKLKRLQTETKCSSRMPIRRRIYPKRMTKKTGAVGFTL